ncbi:hypothetical protein [Phaeobacter sp. B1627]|nr:hypothetical protein [Phaeobacter sp. B1627]
MALLMVAGCDGVAPRSGRVAVPEGETGTGLHLSGEVQAGLVWHD